MSTPMSEAVEAADKAADAVMQCKMMREELHSLRTLLSKVESNWERAAEERDSLASKLATAVEALRWYADIHNYNEDGAPRIVEKATEQDAKAWAAQFGGNESDWPKWTDVQLFDNGDRARTALAAVERKEGK